MDASSLWGRRKPLFCIKEVGSGQPGEQHYVLWRTAKKMTYPEWEHCIGIEMQAPVDRRGSLLVGFVNWASLAGQGNSKKSISCCQSIVSVIMQGMQSRHNMSGSGRLPALHERGFSWMSANVRFWWENHLYFPGGRAGR